MPFVGLLSETPCIRLYGRGTFAKGNNVAYTYETVGEIEDVKVLRGLNGNHLNKSIENWTLMSD